VCRSYPSNLGWTATCFPQSYEDIRKCFVRTCANLLPDIIRNRCSVASGKSPVHFLERITRYVFPVDAPIETRIQNLGEARLRIRTPRLVGQYLSPFLPILVDNSRSHLPWFLGSLLLQKSLGMLERQLSTRNLARKGSKIVQVIAVVLVVVMLPLATPFACMCSRYNSTRFAQGEPSRLARGLVVARSRLKISTAFFSSDLVGLPFRSFCRGCPLTIVASPVVGCPEPRFCVPSHDFLII
jgi:hypothetical protein